MIATLAIIFGLIAMAGGLLVIYMVTTAASGPSRSEREAEWRKYPEIYGTPDEWEKGD